MSTFKQIRSYDIFKTCSDEFVETLAQYASLQAISQGTPIIREGEFNDRLRILANGRVEVRVNNERVAILSHAGDLMGESSALAGRAVSASLIALTDVSFYEIKASDLDQQIKNSHHEFGYQLYAVLAQQLSDKISTTNEKARQFEISARTLADMNQNLDLKVQERTDATFKQLVGLQATLKPLKDLLSDIASRGGPVEEAYAHVSSATDMLDVIREQFSTEREIRSRHVVLAEPDRKLQTLARMALGGTGASLEVTSSRDECLRALGEKPADLIFVSSSLADDVAEIVRAAGPKARVVFMVGHDLASEISGLRRVENQVHTIVSINSADRMFTVRNMATTVTKLFSKDLFGLEKYLMWGVEAKSHPVTSSNDRDRLIAEMTSDLETLGVRSSIRDRAAQVAEELLMNAIYDAPVDHGVHHYAHLPRTESVLLHAHEQGRFRFAADGMLAAISVSDPFGSFRMELLLQYLESNANSTGGNVQTSGKGGAGRGLALILAQSDLVVFNVRPGKQTEAIAFFNLDPNQKPDSVSSFHFFSDHVS